MCCYSVVTAWYKHGHTQVIISSDSLDRSVSLRCGLCTKHTHRTTSLYLRLLSWSFFSPQEKWTNKSMTRGFGSFSTEASDWFGLVWFVFLFHFTQSKLCQHAHQDSDCVLYMEQEGWLSRNPCVCLNTCT